jgi:chromosome segregation ATPase
MKMGPKTVMWRAAALAVVCTTPVHAAMSLEKGPNPIRKIVTLLQGLRQEVEVEAARDKQMFDKAMCFCKKNEERTVAEIEDSEQRIASLEATIKELAGSNAQLKAEIAELDSEIAEDTKSVSEATAVRKEEASQYLSEATDLKQNIAALDTAIPALRKGLSGGAFIETLKPALMRAAQAAVSSDRDQIMSLLQGKTGSPDQILGILENMRDNMKDNLAKSTQEEESAISTYENLMDGKNAELKAATTEASEKKGRVAAQVQKKADSEGDLEDTREALQKAQDFIANLRKSCKDKETEYAANEKLRQEEITGIQDTIGILNDDDALRTFDKTLQAPAAFVQTRSVQMRKIRAVGAASSFVQTSATAQAAKFDKLKAMVNRMVATLGDDQKQDDKQLAWCQSETEAVANQLQSVKNDVTSHTQKMEEVRNEAKLALEEITTLKKEVADMNGEVQEATNERKQQRALFTQTMAEMNLASSLLQKAAERMKQVYAAKEEAPEAALVQSESETADMLGLSFVQLQVNDPAQKKTGKGLGIVALLVKLREEVSAEQAEKTRDEQEQQKDYEQFMADSSAALETKNRDITNKSAARGRLEEVLNAVKKKKKESVEEQAVMEKKDASVKQNCAFIMENHEARKEARANEIEGLKKAVAVLSGADYGAAPAAPAATSFLQRGLH